MLSDKQRKILAFGYTDYDALICDGAIRSGKTSLMMVAFVDWAMRTFDNQNLIICGKTVGSAKRNVVDPYLLMAWPKQRGYRLKWSGYDNTLTVTKGSRANRFMVFGAKDRASFQLVQGFTAAGALIDEVALCDQECVNQCLARCSVDGSRFWFNCNPGAPNHWFRVEWILQAAVKNALHLHFGLEDNPSLSEHVKERYRAMYTGVFKKRYIDGDWVQAEGLVYGVESETISTEAEYIPGEVCWCSIDYGITNPFVAQLWAIREGKALMLDEWSHDGRASGRRLTDSAIYRHLDTFLDGKNVEEIIIDPSATSFKEEIRSHGRYYVRDADNSVNDGIQEVSTLMAEGQLFVNARKCPTATTELGLYMWDSRSAKDQVVKENDHAMDAMRYFVKTVGYDLIRGW